MKYCILLFLIGLSAAVTNTVRQYKWCAYHNHGMCWIGNDGSLSCVNWHGGESIADFTVTGQTVTKRPLSGGNFVHVECATSRPEICAITDTGKLAIWNRDNRDGTLMTGEYDAKDGAKFVSCSCGRYSPTFAGMRDDGKVELFGSSKSLHRTRYAADKTAGKVAADGSWRMEIPPKEITKYWVNRDADGWLMNDGDVSATQQFWLDNLQRQAGYDVSGSNAIDLLVTGGDFCSVLEDGRAICTGNYQQSYVNSPVGGGTKYVRGGCAGSMTVCIPTDAGNVNCFAPQSPEGRDTGTTMARYQNYLLPKNFEPTTGKFVSCACGVAFVCCQRDDGVVECPKKGNTPETRILKPDLNAAQEAALASMDMALPSGGSSSSPACPVSQTAPLLTECSCEGEAAACAVGKFCYGGGCKASALCTVRADVQKNIFYGAKVYGSWNASTKIMSMNFTTPFDVQLNSIAWKNAASQQLKYSKTAPGLWKKDTSNACAPTYKLDVPQTTFFGQGSKFAITGSQLSTNLRVDASETVSTVKNGQTYTYSRTIKNTVPVLVNLVTKTTIAVRFRSTVAPPGPGPKPALEDFVLFLAAEDNFATKDPNVLITMEVHSRSCVDHTKTNGGVVVTTGKDNIETGRASEFVWTKQASGDRKRDFIHNLCVEELQWKFVPAKYKENTYEIDLEFTLRGTGQKFTSTAAIDIKQGDVLSDIGFTSSITPYEDVNCTVQTSKFRLGQKFYTKIELTDLIVPTTNITCNTYKIKQTKAGVTTVTDLKAEAKYNFMQKKSTAPANSHICGAELESHHFHISVDGYDTLLETEILIEYDQTNTRRALVQIPLTKDLWEAAGYMENGEYELGNAELSEEDLEFQNTKRSPDQDDMIVEMYVEAEKAVGITLSGETVSSMQQILMLSVVVSGAVYAFGFVRRKYQDEGYVSMIEMQE